MMKLIYFSLIALSGILFVACGNNTVAEGNEAITDSTIQISAAQFKKAGMELETIKNKPFVNTITSNGYIEVEPNGKASVSVSLGGVISQITVVLGQKVKKGQLLFTIENLEIIQLQQDYMETSAQLEALLENFNRQETYLKEKVGSEKDFLQAKSDYLVMEAKHLGLKQKLLLININPTEVAKGEISPNGKIIAPISGSIASLKYSIGDYINPGDKVMEIINTEQLQLALNVFERDVLNVKVGQKVSFQLPTLIDKAFEAEIINVGQKILENNGSIPVHCKVTMTNHQSLIPGMFVKAYIVVSQENKPALPESSVIELDNQTYILVLNKYENEVYHFSKTHVKVGINHDKNIEIKQPVLRDGQEILVKGAFIVLN